MPSLLSSSTDTNITWVLYMLVVCAYILGVHQNSTISPFIVVVFHGSLVLISQLLGLFFNGKIKGKIKNIPFLSLSSFKNIK